LQEYSPLPNGGTTIVGVAVLASGGRIVGDPPGIRFGAIVVVIGKSENTVLCLIIFMILKR
jgi:hypothetical protein